MDKQILKQRLQKEFYPNFCAWAINDAEREAKSDFFWLSTMHDVHLSYYLEIIKTFTRLEQISLLIALTKISYQKSGEFLEIAVTPDEQIVLDNYYSKLKARPHHMTDIFQAYYVRKSFLKIKFSTLASLVHSELDSILGAPKLEAKDYLEYGMPINSEWYISTSFHLSTTSIQYAHLLSALPSSRILNDEEKYQNRLVFSNPISLPRWLGFKSSTWTFFSKDDPAIATRTIAHVCTHFLKSLPTLLAPLSTLL